MPKNGRKKSKNGENNDNEAMKEMIENLHKRQKLQEERQDKWNEAWQRKLADEEQLEDLKARCAPDEYFPAPRAQSNLWLQVSHEKNTQNVQMSFMNVAIPKPGPPPLPKLPVPCESSSAQDDKSKMKKKKK